MQTSVHQGRTYDRDENGKTSTETVTGTLSEMLAYQEALDFDNVSGGLHITNSRVSQVAGSEWKCEIFYADENSGGSVVPPSSAYGKKSATLSAGSIRMPLEHHKNYLANWNYYLAQGLRAGQSVETPEWWMTATSIILDKQTAQQYKWVKSASELPGDPDRFGRTWQVIRNPEKPGVEGYDLSTYQVTESVKQPNATQCGYYIVGRLNKIVSPNETFGLTGGDWKCDSASVQWDGCHWKATLTYTKSGDDAGWDPDLYEAG